MRKPIIAGNHKMNLTPAETNNLLQELRKEIDNYQGVQVIVCPPFTSLAIANNALVGSNIELGAQNVHQEQKGAFTGEVSANMLKSIGCTWVICGHSERRHIFGESNEIVNAKIKAVITTGLKPILCVGETLQDRQQGKTDEVITNQLVNSLQGLTAIELSDLVVAYEPVWAIGTGKTATPEDAEAGCSLIRQQLTKLFGEDVAQKIRILYGGSVKPTNITTLMSEENIDGALVGGASLKSSDFSSIVKYNE